MSVLVYYNINTINKEERDHLTNIAEKRVVKFITQQTMNDGLA